MSVAARVSQAPAGWLALILRFVEINIGSGSRFLSIRGKTYLLFLHTFLTIFLLHFIFVKRQFFRNHFTVRPRNRNGETPMDEHNCEPGASNQSGDFQPEIWRWFKDCWHWSRCEVEVAQLMLSGPPEKHIARAMGIEKTTLHDHVKQIFRKTGVHNRVEFTYKLFLRYIQLREANVARSDARTAIRRRV